MDVLSDAVAAARTGSPHSARVRHPASFGRWFAAFEGAGFHVVLGGSCWLIPPDGPPIALGAGDVVFLPHGCAHGLADSLDTPLADGPGPTLAEVTPTDDGGTATVLLCGAYLLDRSRSHPLLAELPDVVHLAARVGGHSALRDAVNLLGSELDRPRPGADAALPVLLDLLLLYILRAWFDDQAERVSQAGGTGNRRTDGSPGGDDAADAAAGTSWAAALRDVAVATALSAIHGDPGRQWTVDELGRLAGLSRAAFARRFTSLVGRPPSAYLTWWRMTLAAGLLRDSDAPLSAVARQVGYGSEFAFAHAFKREYGTPPGGYRRANLMAAGRLAAPGRDD